VWRAQPRQGTFLRRDEDEVLYGGAAGGGKSDALLIWLISRAQKHPGSNGLYLRRTYTDLSKAGCALDRSRDLLTGIAKYNQELHRWTLPNSSVIDFGHMEHEDDKYRYNSSQYDSIAFDELTEFSEGQYTYMLSRNRATVDNIKPQVRSATNPGQLGHQWVRRRFIDPANAEEPFNLGNNRRGCFIPARLQDNQVLLSRDPGYWDRLMSLPENERRALAFGDWDVFAGQFFTEWRSDVHVCKPFKIPAHWLRWLSVDYGFADPWCVLFWARDPEARHHVYIYRELYATGVRDEEQARRIAKVCKGEQVRMAVGDPSMFNKRSEQDKPSIAAVYWKHGVKIIPGVNSRVSGWQVVRQLLAYDDSTKPRLQVLDGCAPNLCRTLPAMIYDPLDSEDLADKIKSTKTEDHAVDSLRYGAVLEAMPEQQKTKLREFRWVAA
jgi:hypothetical protein